jgi:hypothetical protein
MKQLISISALVLVAMAVPALAGGTVTLDLLSPSSGVNYRAGGPSQIDWTITATLSSGDNMGLALISVDLVQDPYNPAPVELMPADAVPLEMVGFDRPAGFSNPGNGYLGTQVDGWFGAVDLVQIGGAQNTFGGLPEPVVAGYGEDFDVDPNIGQSAGGQIIATGSFTLSCPTALGAYSFALQSTAANTLEMVNEAPKWSPVSAATVETCPSGGTLQFVLCLAADADGSGDLAVEDITTFVDLLLGTAAGDAYQLCAVDLDDDGQITGQDIQYFVDAFLAG